MFRQDDDYTFVIESWIYVDSNGAQKMPVMIYRTMCGSFKKVI